MRVKYRLQLFGLPTIHFNTTNLYHRSQLNVNPATRWHVNEIAFLHACTLIECRNSRPKKRTHTECVEHVLSCWAPVSGFTHGNSVNSRASLAQPMLIGLDTFILIHAHMLIYRNSFCSLFNWLDDGSLDDSSLSSCPSSNQQT